jgi:hypothetical protein
MLATTARDGGAAGWDGIHGRISVGSFPTSAYTPSFLDGSKRASLIPGGR